MARPLDGYPDSFGSHRASVIGVTGPTSYTQFTAPSTGGQLVDAGKFGVKGLEFVDGNVSDDGLYFVRCVPTVASNGPGGQCSQYRLVWYVLATGAQVAALTNLSGVTVRLFALGNKS